MMNIKKIPMEPLISQFQGWPISAQVIFGLVILSIIYSFLAGDRPYPGLPLAKIEQDGIKPLIHFFLPGFSWMLSPREVLAKGKEISKAHDGIYQVRASGGYKIVLPRRYAEEIRNSEYMTFLGSVKKDFHATQPGFEGMLEGCREDGLVIDVIHKLIQSLDVVLGPVVDEANYSISVWFGDNEEEWRSVDLKDAVVDIIARTATRAFAGKDLARNEDWIRVSRDHVITAFAAAIILHHVPAFLRPILVWVIPECRKQRRQLADAKRLLAPRLQEIEQRNQDGIEEPGVPDAFTWLMDVAKGRPINFVLAQLNLSEGSVHTTTELVTRLIIQCCETPNVVNELREEIIRVLQDEGGWSKPALYKMKLLDSFMKEVSRYRPLSVTSMLRDVRRDVTLSNGVVLPAGGLVMVEDDGNKDPNINPQPEKFDAHRYLRLRDKPDGDRNQFTMTSPDNLVFGYGTHQCPGRQFASNEAKVVFSFMLLKYDWRFEPDYTLVEAFNFESRVAAPNARVQYRRRQAEIDLLEVKAKRT
ncbi:ent-kaurene oxidase [Phlyctema vagabunda]|uniref:Ent-kaurene oxidase n=1 Tax=Phlyctema vagabunda TaxID=108571 RepID=A0ABR4PUF1_9HELO